MLSDCCGIVYAMDIISGRWKMLILYNLEEKKLRFSEIKKLIPNITERMLTLQLKELERDNLIKRSIYVEVPVRVEYELTSEALKLSPIWHALEIWGDEHRELNWQADEEKVMA